VYSSKKFGPGWNAVVGEAYSFEISYTKSVTLYCTALHCTALHCMSQRNPDVHVFWRSPRHLRLEGELKSAAGNTSGWRGEVSVMPTFAINMTGLVNIFSSGGIYGILCRGWIKKFSLPPFMWMYIQFIKRKFLQR
jgi:hypothetical protein